MMCQSMVLLYSTAQHSTYISGPVVSRVDRQQKKIFAHNNLLWTSPSAWLHAQRLAGKLLSPGDSPY